MGNGIDVNSVGTYGRKRVRMWLEAAESGQGQNPPSVLCLVRERVMITATARGTHQHRVFVHIPSIARPRWSPVRRTNRLTIACFSLYDELALDHDATKAFATWRERRDEEVHECEGVDAAGPESLEGLGVLGPCLEENLEAGLSCDGWGCRRYSDVLEQSEDGVAMTSVDEIRERDDETLQSSLITVVVVVVVVDLPTYLDKRGSLDGRHPAHHSLKKLR